MGKSKWQRAPGLRKGGTTTYHGERSTCQGGDDNPSSVSGHRYRDPRLNNTQHGFQEQQGQCGQLKQSLNAGALKGPTDRMTTQEKL